MSFFIFSSFSYRGLKKKELGKILPWFLITFLEEWILLGLGVSHMSAEMAANDETLSALFSKKGGLIVVGPTLFGEEIHSRNLFGRITDLCTLFCFSDSDGDLDQDRPELLQIPVPEALKVQGSKLPVSALFHRIMFHCQLYYLLNPEEVKSPHSYGFEIRQ